MPTLRATPGVLVYRPPSPVKLQSQLSPLALRVYNPRNSNMRFQKIVQPVAMPSPPIRPPIMKPSPPPHTLTPPKPRILSARCAVNARCFAPHQICAPTNHVRVARLEPGSLPVANVAARTLRGVGKDRVLLIIAAGPSINEIDFTRLKGHPLIDVMCINKPYPPLWPTKFWSFCDHSQYERTKDIWNSYEGIIINSTNVRARKSNQIVIKGHSGKGWSRDITGGFYVGRSSTYAGMQLAAYMDYKRVYLCGVDMGSGAWWYGTNPDVSSETRQKRFADEAQSYLYAANKLEPELKDRFVFCSTYNKWPFVEYFKRLDQKVVVDEILKYIDELNSSKNKV